MGEIVLETKNLKIGNIKAANPIVDNVSLIINEKEIIGIVGESGCGKSMTGLAVMDLLPSNIKILSGEIKFKGKNITRQDISKIRGKDMAMIFQEPTKSLHPLHKVGKQIEEVFKIHTNLSKKEAKKKTIELMKAVEIPNAEVRYEQYPHQLSGGLNQRVMIAMAIAMNPKLLIADEPTTALDVTIQNQILKMLRFLRDSLGISFVLISHDLAVVCENCDYIYVMYCGQIVEEGDVRTFFLNPKHPYTKALIQASPDPDKRNVQLKPIEGKVPSIDNIPKGCRFAERCRYRECFCQEHSPELFRQKDGSAVRCFRYEGGRRGE